MNDEIKHGHAGHDAEFEHEDLGTRGVFVFLIGLAVVGMVIYFIIVGMYSFLDNYERSQMATASPLVTSRAAMSRVVTQDDMDKMFKDNGAPMLETNERGQFHDFLMNQENQLNSYGWMDERAGMAHIPIERAMDIMVQHGIPVYSKKTSSNGAVEADAAGDRPAAKGKSSAQ